MIGLSTIAFMMSLIILPAASLATAATSKDQPQATEASPASCVKHQQRVRYSLGYDHLVDLENTCKKPVNCQVWTNVNQAKQSVTLAENAKATVITYVGSPAREFTHFIECVYVN